MFEHFIDHSTPNTVLVCPTDERLPEREVGGPYNELGMPGDREATREVRGAARERLTIRRGRRFRMRSDRIEPQ